MTSPERTARAEQACAELAAAGQPVTFTAVAGRAGIGRATLYRHPALRALIDSHRRDVAGAGTPPPDWPTTSQPCAPPSRPSPPASATTKNKSGNSTGKAVSSPNAAAAATN